ncbi:GNAT family N-acetyltransferase [Nocardioides bruguierae]|uniref:Lysine N-acyltransferase MbtK n=1 Tax=Nocardioides bruguierae TaxID=2945102 RepID=A0A9X2D5A2_9ACTN|nr:GNAT family N-acetyltransferase [Nocardioides bruguierae]MCM0619707.1 GNAT family N-acetyltransferase [Nocardioides bruguierae]
MSTHDLTQPPTQAPTQPGVTLEPLPDDPGTTALLHAWVTHPRSRFWQMQDATAADVAQEYRDIAASAHHDAWLGRVDGRPTFLAETYDPSRSPLADVGADLREGDLGMHLLVAPPVGPPRAGLTRAVMAAVLEHCFADPRVARVVVEPDVGNDAIARLNAEAGFVEVGTVRLPDKTARLSFLERADWARGQYPAPHLRPDVLARAQRQLVAKAIAELCHERLLAPRPATPVRAGGGSGGESAPAWTLTAPDGTEYRFTARRLPLEHWDLDPASLTRTRDGVFLPLDVQELVAEHAEPLGLRGELVAVYLEELAATLAWTCWQLDRPRMGVEDLLGASHAEVEAAVTEGHPGFVANRGRIGLGLAAHEAWSPDAARPVRLHWVAARRAASGLWLGRGWSAQDLPVLGPGRERDVLHARLRRHGLDPADYLLLPVHPWQWDAKVAVTFAPDVARRDLVPLGEGLTRYQAMQSIRTFTDLDDPRRVQVKTALAIQNMGFTRGLSPAYMEATPAVSDWVASVVEADPELHGRGFQVLREVAAAGYTGDVFHRHAPGAPQRKMLAALWRESPASAARPGERVVTMAALLHRDAAGDSYAAALVRASGLEPRAWVARYLDAYLRPVAHCLLAHDLAFMPHGENLLVALVDHAPVRCVMKDLGEEVALLSPDRPLPAGAERARARVDPDERCLAVLTDVVDGFLRHLAAVLDGAGVLPVSDFWDEAAGCLERHAADHPELADAVAAVGLQRPRFPHSCLNRLQLRDARQMVDIADQASSLLYAGTLENPLHRPEGADGATTSEGGEVGRLLTRP